MENIIFLVLFLIISYKTYSYVVTKKRTEFIKQYEFPRKIGEAVIATYPHLNSNDVNKVLDGLRQYFVICNKAKLRMISMPSQVVDVAWHEFILFTRDYKKFCKHSFGKFLHHNPAESMTSSTVAQDGIKRAWRLSCEREKMDPKNAHRLPLLFGIDSALEIPDGFKYSLDCKNNQDRYCAGHIGCGGGCSGGGCSGDGGGGCGGGGD